MGIKSSVSLYSLQYQYLWGKMTLEDLLSYLKELGTEGVELLPDQMIHGAPTPTQEEIDRWCSLIKKYGLTPSCDDIFLNTNLYLNRTLTKRECYDLVKSEIVLAHKLGFKNIRLVSFMPAWILEPCLETAIENDVSLSIEMHGGQSFGCKLTDEFIEEMLRLDSPYIGIVPDSSIFMRRPPRIVTEYCDKLFGLNPDLVKYIEDTFAEGKDMFRKKMENGGQMDPKMVSLIKMPGDEFYAANIEGYENRPLSCLDDFTKYIKHYHFKLYEMTEEGTEYSINYEEILKHAHGFGYDGFVSTEYEGNRWTLPGEEIQEVKQVAAHQKMLQRLIREIEG